MKQTVYDGSRKTTVNTRYDPCLYRAPRFADPARGSKEVGKDLYMHEQAGGEKMITYYLHLWSNNRSIRDKILPVSPQIADRFLKARGIACDLFPKNDATARLYAWGYGIAEEF